MNTSANDTISNLNYLSQKRKQLELLVAQYEAKRIEIIAPVQEELDALDAEMSPVIEICKNLVTELEDGLKADVLKIGETVKGTYLQAVYTKPRVTWDGKLLEGYAVAHPEILAAQKIGSPSVSFREVRS